MKKYLITYNAGFGEEYETVECENQDEADQLAYEIWRAAVQDNATYSAKEMTEEDISELEEDDLLADQNNSNHQRRMSR